MNVFLLLADHSSGNWDMNYLPLVARVLSKLNKAKTKILLLWEQAGYGVGEENLANFFSFYPQAGKDYSQRCAELAVSIHNGDVRNEPYVSMFADYFASARTQAQRTLPNLQDWSYKWVPNGKGGQSLDFSRVKREGFSQAEVLLCKEEPVVDAMRDFMIAQSIDVQAWASKDFFACYCEAQRLRIASAALRDRSIAEQAKKLALSDGYEAVIFTRGLFHLATMVNALSPEGDTVTERIFFPFVTEKMIGAFEEGIAAVQAGKCSEDPAIMRYNSIGLIVALATAFRVQVQRLEQLYSKVAGFPEQVLTDFRASVFAQPPFTQNARIESFKIWLAANRQIFS